MGIAGCGNEPPIRSYQPYVAQPVAPPPPQTVAQADPLQLPPDDQDPLITPDPLTQGSTNAPSDPLAQGSTAASPDPLAAPDDSVASTADPLSNPPTAIHHYRWHGQAMPTDHSHWLRGQIINSHVAIDLNGIRLGEYASPIDMDITMKLHAGVNTITFKYHPVNQYAMAQLSLLESEHTPPIPPLATFRSPGRLLGSADKLQDITQTATFVAR